MVRLRLDRVGEYITNDYSCAVWEIDENGPLFVHVWDYDPAHGAGIITSLLQIVRKRGVRNR